MEKGSWKIFQIREGGGREVGDWDRPKYVLFCDLVPYVLKSNSRKTICCSAFGILCLRFFHLLKVGLLVPKANRFVTTYFNLAGTDCFFVLLVPFLGFDVRI